MSTASIYTDDLIGPVSLDRPAGVNLRWTAEWDRITEARRADDELEPGKWAKKERKAADWRLVEQLTSVMLRERSKDLQLALWLTEAGMKLHGFAGLREGLRVTRELLVRYWDHGLFPLMEDGPEDRAGPLEWLNNKLVNSILEIPITAREDGREEDLSLLDLRDARHTGSEQSCKDADGEVDAAKKKAYDLAIETGHVSLEAFERAVANSTRVGCEAVCESVQQTCDEFKALERVMDEKFGDLSPNMSGLRTVLSEIKQEVTDILARKRPAEPDVQPTIDAQRQATEASAPSAPVTYRMPLSVSEVTSQSPGVSGTWQEAEILIKSGQVDKGLAEMVRLAACETSGRNRFLRKLLLAEACLYTKRERLARSILEELAEHIDKLQLEAWESSELIASVWTRLYKLYKQGGGDGDLEHAAKLYGRLCRLDPWQALGCAEE